MGEFIKHRSVEGEAIKIGVHRGIEYSDLELFMTRELLIELRDAGFESFYGGEFTEINEIDSYIENYDLTNRDYVYYRDISDIVKEYPEYSDLF